MDIKKIYKFFIFLILFFFIAVEKNFPEESLVFDYIDSEEEEAEEPKNYSLHEEDGRIRFTQKLQWPPVENIGFYLIEVEEEISDESEEKNDGEKKYKPLLSQKVDENFFELSLNAGFYRYRISLFNVLGRMEQRSQWLDFTVLKATQPVLSVDGNNFVYISEKKVSKTKDIVLKGNNFSPDSKVKLVFEDRDIKILINGNVKKCDDACETLQVTFDFSKLCNILSYMRGEDPSVSDLPFSISVTNPGGLHAEKDGFFLAFEKEVKEKKPRSFDFDLDIALGMSLPWQIIGSDFTENKLYGEFFSSSMLFPTFTGRISFLPVKTKAGFFGLGLTGDFSSVKNSVERRVKSYTLTGQIVTLYADFIWQKPLGRFTFDLHAGGGIQLFQDFKYDFYGPLGSYSNSGPNSIYPAINAGAALQFSLIKDLYAELKCDLCYNMGSGWQTGCLEPALLLGWKF